MHQKPQVWLSYVFLIGTTLLVLGGLRCSPQTSKKPGSDSGVESSTIEDASQPTSLTIGSGSLKNSKLDVPADGLPAGTNVSLREGETPSEFSGATTGDSSAASSSLQVDLKDSAGADVTSTGALAISMPYGSGASLVGAVAQEAKNLILLIKSSKGDLLYLPFASFLNVDESAKIVKFQVKTGGFFQLVFMSTPPSSFRNAETAGVSPVDASTVDLSGYACPTGQTNSHSAVKENSGFVDYLKFYTNCVCNLIAQTEGKDCRSSIKESFGKLICVSDGTASSITQNQWTETFSSASTEFKKYCDGKTYTPPSDDSDDDDDGTTNTSTETKASSACTYTKENELNYCFEYANYPSSVLDSVKTSCTNANSSSVTTAIVGSCPTAQAFGYCVIDYAGGGAEALQYKYYYYKAGAYANYTAAQLKLACETGANGIKGTWTSL